MENDQDQVGTNFWSATLAAYEPLQLPFPEITVRRLQKPPFRFIHDLVSSINARFGTYTQIVSPELADSSTIDTKEKKIEFLKPLIDYVGKLLNTKVDVNPKKIITGNDAEKTNVFLQQMAMAVGYAQQAKLKSEAAAPEPPLPSAPAVSDSPYPHPSALPRRKPSTQPDMKSYDTLRQEAIAAAHAFQKKISGFSLNLNPDARRTIAEEGQSIVRMWQELTTPTTTINTSLSNMGEEALGLAIKRQLEALKQVEGLVDECDKVTDQVERLIM